MSFEIGDSVKIVGIDNCPKMTIVSKSQSKNIGDGTYYTCMFFSNSSGKFTAVQSHEDALEKVGEDNE